MLNEFAFANSLAILTGLLYVLFVVLGFVAPNAFKFLFNAQFLGADVASLVPRRAGLRSVVATIVTLIVTGWVFGYVWAGLYNWLARYF